jgi:ACS family glucarate transporter-like MFS transporter
VARKVPIVSGMLLALIIVACNYVETDTLVLLFMSLAFFGKGVGAMGWAVMADVAPGTARGFRRASSTCSAMSPRSSPPSSSAIS